MGNWLHYRRLGLLLATLCLAGPAVAAGPQDGAVGEGESHLRSDLYEPLQESEAAVVAPSPVPTRLYPLYRKMRNPASDDAESVAKGRLLFGANCKVCHGAEGEAVGSGLEPAPRDLTSPALQAARRDGELFYAIKNGIRDTSMLPWGGRLSDRDIWMMVRYLRFLSQP